MKAPEGEPDHYAIEIHWTWGGGGVTGMRFSEVYRFAIHSRDELNGEIERFLKSMVERHAFDCSRWTHPMVPVAHMVSITPVYTTDNQYIDESWDKLTDLLICEKLVRLIDQESDRKRERNKK